MMPESLHPLQIAAWRRMSPSEKWALALGANRLLRDSARRRVARQHPDWTPEAVEREVSRFFARART
jgi:hypothetical protein